MPYDLVDGQPATYLGDGVYALFDGFGIWLHANDHRAALATDKIYLEPSTPLALISFADALRSPEAQKGDPAP